MSTNDPLPPRWPLRFLEKICPDYLFEEIEGDLLQTFQKDVKNLGLRRARIRFALNACCFFRPGIVLRNQFSISILPLYMMLNYFKVASRLMLRNKFFSIINISGLALGITGAVLLFLWVMKEFSYDQFHADKQRIYKAWNRNTIEGNLQCWDLTPRVLAPSLKAEYPGIESSISYANYGASYLFRVGDKSLMRNTGAFTDPEFLTMFSFPLLKGEALHALNRPDGIVITESLARDLFGDQDAFGEIITISDSGYDFEFSVTGILKDLPDETDFGFEYLIPFQFLENMEGRQVDWSNNGAHTYVKLHENADATLLNDQIKNIVKRHTHNIVDTEVFLYPLTKMRLYSRFENGIAAGGRIEVMRMIIILGVCLILIACINFINLSTARAQKRSKEVGIRKVTGAYRSSLVGQFLCESVLLSLIAGAIALASAYLLLPFFNQLVNQKISFDVGNTLFWIAGVGGIVVIGIIAGLYPAIYLSSFRPVKILKGASVTLGSRNLFRRILVVSQFGLAITLIFSTLVIRKQIIHVQNREAGYDKNNLLYHYITGDLNKNYPAYRNELIQNGNAESVTKTSAPITEAWSSTWDIKWDGKDPQSKIVVERFYMDEHFVTTAGVSLVSGRDMDLSRYPSDSSAVLLNETAAKIMGFDNPLGEIIKDGETEWHVVGVIKDFVLTSPYHRVNPMVLQGSKGWFNVVHIRLREDKPVHESIAGIQALFKKFNQVYPFDYYFVDDSYRKKFVVLEKTLTITTLFAFVVVFIACLGLLGLSTYMIESKTKEIGVRKVLGGSVTSITRLLCLHSLKPIALAMLLFTPGSWYAMNWWLQFSEYRISLDLSVLAMAWLSILSIALLTVGIQTVKAAMVNPVNSLKQE